MVSILMLAGLFFGLVSYLDTSFSINRKTGQVFKTKTYYGIIKDRTEETGLFTRGGELIGLTPMTAADTEVFINNTVLRFPWSEAGESTGVINQHGDKLLTAFSELFHFDPQKKIPDEFWNNMIVERIRIWNSSEVDDNPDAVITKAREENTRRAELLKNMRFSRSKR